MIICFYVQAYKDEFLEQRNTIKGVTWVANQATIIQNTTIVLERINHFHVEHGNQNSSKIHNIKIKTIIKVKLHW